jgi:phosphatidylinositol phospholipase C, epsilon
LVKAGKTDEQAENYVLVEDVQKGWDHREADKGGGSQRVLDANENVLHAQSKWKGNGRFLLRKKSSVSRNMSRVKRAYSYVVPSTECIT